MDEEYLKETAYVTASIYRVKIMKYLQEKEYASPKIISKDIQVNTSHTSKTLTDLSKHHLVRCINPEARKNRLYRLTEYGETIIQYLNVLR